MRSSQYERGVVYGITLILIDGLGQLDSSRFKEEYSKRQHVINILIIAHWTERKRQQ